MYTEERQLTELKGMTAEDVLSLVYFFITLLLLEKFDLLPVTEFAGGPSWKWTMYGMLIIAAVGSQIQQTYRQQLIRS